VKADNCLFCEFKLGFPIRDFTIGKAVFKFTTQWDGVALSWANQAKLAYGTNAATSGDNAPQIWDGFRNQPLPEVNDINFWIRFRFNLIELASWTKVVEKCKLDLPILTVPASLKILSIVFDVELYLAVDRQTTDGEAVGTSFANDFTGGTGGQRNLIQSDGEKMWRNMQEGTTSEDPCIILTMPRAAVKLPFFLGEIVFADALGGFCIFSPEETGTRCTPSGFFFNIRNQFRIEGGMGGILASILEENIPENDILPPLESASNR
jgi:hypothetical protein